MPTWFAVAVLVAAVGLTYFCCVRPTRRGTSSAGRSSAESPEQVSRREEIDQLRTEIAQARRDLQTNRSQSESP